MCFSSCEQYLPFLEILVKLFFFFSYLLGARSLLALFSSENSLVRKLANNGPGSGMRCIRSALLFCLVFQPFLHDEFVFICSWYIYPERLCKLFSLVCCCALFFYIAKYECFTDNEQVFLVLWWWFFLLTLIGLTVLLYRGVQCRYTHLSFSLTLAPFSDFQVFLVLWWWFTLLFVIGLVRLVYRFIQCRYSTASAPTACRGKVVKYSRIKGTISFIFFSLYICC